MLRVRQHQDLVSWSSCMEAWLGTRPRDRSTKQTKDETHATNILHMSRSMQSYAVHFLIALCSYVNSHLPPPYADPRELVDERLHYYWQGPVEGHTICSHVAQIQQRSISVVRIYIAESFIIPVAARHTRTYDPNSGVQQQHQPRSVLLHNHTS